MYKSWARWCKATAEPVRDTINIVQDFSISEAVSSGNEDESPTKKKRKANSKSGISALAVDYIDHKSHVEKGKNITDFEQEGQCALCRVDLEHDAGLYAICPKPGCDSVTHLTCLGRHFLQGEDDTLVPLKGRCPSCKTELQWVDVVKELTLRIRGQKESEKLLKVKKIRKGKGVTASQAIADSEEDADEEAEEIEEEMEQLREFDQQTGPTHLNDAWDSLDDSDDTGTGIIAATGLQAKKATKAGSPKNSKNTRTMMVIEDSDWDEAIEL